MPRGNPRPLAERLWEKVEKGGPMALWKGAPGPCWVWTASRTKGYGMIRSGRTNAYAHRVAYELSVGPIPEGLHLDHRCRRPHCVNPAHLEPVTNAENVRRGNAGLLQARKTHCKQGHPFEGDNLIIRADGTGRACRECHRVWSAEFALRRKREERHG